MCWGVVGGGVRERVRPRVCECVRRGQACVLCSRACQYASVRERTVMWGGQGGEGEGDRVGRCRMVS